MHVCSGREAAGCKIKQERWQQCTGAGKIDMTRSAFCFCQSPITAYIINVLFPRHVLHSENAPHVSFVHDGKWCPSALAPSLDARCSKSVIGCAVLPVPSINQWAVLVPYASLQAHYRGKHFQQAVAPNLPPLCCQHIKPHGSQHVHFALL